MTKSEAAQALGISTDSLERYVLGDLKLIRENRLVLIPVFELERWVAERAVRTLPKP